MPSSHASFINIRPDALSGILLVMYKPRMAVNGTIYGIQGQEVLYFDKPQWAKFDVIYFYKLYPRKCVKAPIYLGSKI